jgi:hypothetical protein
MAPVDPLWHQACLRAYAFPRTKDCAGETPLVDVEFKTGALGRAVRALDLSQWDSGLAADVGRVLACVTHDAAMLGVDDVDGVVVQRLEAPLVRLTRHGSAQRGLTLLIALNEVVRHIAEERARRPPASYGWAGMLAVAACAVLVLVAGSCLTCGS